MHKKIKGFAATVIHKCGSFFCNASTVQGNGPRVHEVTPKLPPPATQFWATTALHINGATLNRPKTTVFSLSLSLTTTFILTLYNYITPKPFPWERFAEHSQFSVQRLVGSLNWNNNQLCQWSQHGRQARIPPPPSPHHTSTHTLLLKYRKKCFHDAIIFLHIMSPCSLQQNAFNAGVITTTSQQNFAAQDWGTPGNRREGAGGGGNQANSICQLKNVSFTMETEAKVEPGMKMKETCTSFHLQASLGCCTANIYPEEIPFRFRLEFLLRVHPCWFPLYQTEKGRLIIWYSATQSGPVHDLSAAGHRRAAPLVVFMTFMLSF